MEHKTIPFSEAMLLGLPEIRFSNSSWLYKNEAGCTGCLVGAALYAVGRRHIPGSIAGEMGKFWPWLKEGFPMVFGCPWCEKSFDWSQCSGFDGCMRAADLATHFARHYKSDQVTAEQIAEVFRKLEPKEEPERSAKEDTHEVQRSSVARVAGD